MWLTQLYGLRYGTLPLVRSVGGLATRWLTPTQRDRCRNGDRFTFAGATMTDLSPRSGVPSRALPVAGPCLAMIKQAMAQDFSWNKAATAYGATMTS